MKYKVLYRKYRPDDFENIIGQEYITTTLKNSIINDKISHAYIFSGPRGTGKTSTAKVFAKAINCLNPENGSPCGKCEFCLNFKENPDIIELDAASNNGVDEIRTIIDNIKLTPTNGKYKVYIIDEVHMLTQSAFNALLLTLEEPPSHTIFILATTNIENVPITILSRCQRFDFQKITVDKITSRLAKVCELENISTTDDALREIAYLSEGGMRDALSLLDQLSKNNGEITLELIENQIKVISQKTIKELIAYIENNDTENILNIINELKNRSTDYKTLVKKIIDIASQNAKNIKITGRYERLQFDDYKKLINELSESLSKININVDNYTILEMILLSYINKPETSNKNENHKKVDLLSNNSPKQIVEDSMSNIINTKQDLKNNVINNELIKIRINNCFAEAKRENLEIAKVELANLVNNVDISGKLKSLLLDSEVVAASTRNLILICKNDHNVELANQVLSKIENEFLQKVNKEYKIIFLSNEDWKKEKEKYILDLKNKKEYKYIEEQNNKLEESTPLEISDVFDKSKVEIV